MKSRILIAAVVGAFAMGTAYAQITKEEFKSRQESIEANYKSAKATCAPMKANAKDICMAEAKGQHEVATKELLATYKPSDKHRQAVVLAKAEAGYRVAREKCDDLKGNDKDVCVKEARAQEIKAKADVKVAEARIDALQEKRDAAYQVEREKCDALAGTAKDNCLSAAKAKFGKN